MNSDLDFFKKLLLEASDDEQPPDSPPDTQDSPDDSAPPDMPSDDSSINIEDSPDIGSDDNDMPPDLNDSGGDDFGSDDFGGNDDQSGDNSNQQNNNLELDDKISAIMNQTLYQRFLGLIGKVASQISQIKDNTDCLYAIAPECTDVLDSLTGLEKNIRMYLKNQFVHETYNKNLLFFNKCLNLLALTNDIFDDIIKKGLKHMDP